MTIQNQNQYQLQDQGLFLKDNNQDFEISFKPPREKYTDVATAGRVARKLVNNSTVAMVNTKYKSNNDTLVMSLPEYSIDCFDNGNPILILIQMSHTYRNIVEFGGFDSSLSYTVSEDLLHEDWPGAVRGTMYGMPRVSLRGYFRELVVEEESNGGNSGLEVRYISKEEEDGLKKCFETKHKESSWWFPGNKGVHSSVWTEFVVSDGYFVGGFGGYAYIGEVGSSSYHY